MHHLDLSYPDAERLPLVEQLHGHEIADPYRWLEDADHAADPAVAGGPGRALAEPRDHAARPVPVPHPGRRPCPASVRSPRRSGAADRCFVAPPHRPAGTPGPVRRRRRSCSIRRRSTPPAGPLSTAGSPRPTGPCWPSRSRAAAASSPSCTCSTSTPASWSTARSTAAATPRSPGCPTASPSTTCASARSCCRELGRVADEPVLADRSVVRAGAQCRRPLADHLRRSWRRERSVARGSSSAVGQPHPCSVASTRSP